MPYDQAMSLVRSAVLVSSVASLCVGCVSASHVPRGATQEIGAVHYLTSSKARWDCLGGEELALVETPGKKPRLYVASLDLVVDQASEDGEQRNFELVREPSMTNANTSAALYAVPRDPQGDLEVRFSRLFTTATKSTSSTWKAGDTTYTSTTTRRTYGSYAFWGDRCVPHGTGEDVNFAKVYRGAQPVRGELPAQRFVLGLCAFNAGLDGKLRMGRRTDIDLHAEVEMDLLRAAALSALFTGSMAIVPPLVWADDAGNVTMARADGSGIKLTYPHNLWGTDGFLYERASVPVFVTLKPGSEGVFLFVADPDPPPPGTDPRPVGKGVNETFAAFCRLQKVKP